MNQQRILITGATGLVGRALTQELLKHDAKLVIVGRSPKSEFRQKFSFPCQYFQWTNPNANSPPFEALNVDHVINLMGESLTGRWTKERKKEFYNSRVLTARQLVRALKKSTPDLKTFLSASAIGFYGNRGEEELTEKSPGAEDFLGILCRDWEGEVAQSQGRTVSLRIGMVLAKDGGALEKLVRLFQMGMGGRLSSGLQWMSWIHINDLVQIFIQALKNEKFRGPINAVAPEPVKNTLFTDELAGSLNTKAYFPVPRFALKLALGEMADVVLSSQRVKPQILESMNFKYQFPNIHLALQDLFKGKSE